MNLIKKIVLNDGVTCFVRSDTRSIIWDKYPPCDVMAFLVSDRRKDKNDWQLKTVVPFQSVLLIEVE